MWSHFAALRSSVERLPSTFKISTGRNFPFPSLYGYEKVSRTQFVAMSMSGAVMELQQERNLQAHVSYQKYQGVFSAMMDFESSRQGN